MNGRFADLIFNARRRVGLTVERAAECLGISPRTLSYYEAGRYTPDNVVSKMVELYKTQELGYVWLSRELSTGRMVLPSLETWKRKKKNAALISGQHGSKKSV